MNLHFWNYKQGTIWQLLGDIDLEVANVSSNIGGGFCIGLKEKGLFDCAQFGISLDLDTLDDPDNLKVSLIDSYQPSGPDLSADSRIFDDTYNNLIDPARNWVLANDRQAKKCEIRSGSNGEGKDFSCSVLNVGFVRYFQTDSASQDLNFSVG